MREDKKKREAKKEEERQRELEEERIREIKEVHACTVSCVATAIWLNPFRAV